MSEPTNSLIAAVIDGDDAQVRRLVAQGAPVDERNRKGETPLILAAKTDQFRTAEFLLQSGADVMAASRFGWTAGYAAQSSRLARGPEADARDRVLAELKARGFPFPAPHPADLQGTLHGSAEVPAR